MVASTRQSIGFVVISILQLVVGIIVLVLSNFWFVSILALAGNISGVTVPTISIWWILGVPYFVPVIPGFLAAALKGNGWIGLCMALNIVVLIVAGAFAILSVLFLSTMASVGGINCRANPLSSIIGERCICSVGSTIQSLPVNVADCESLNNVFTLMYGVTAMIIIGGILCLAASIVCCNACCSTAPSSGLVYVPGQHGYEMGAGVNTPHRQQTGVINPGY